LVSSIGMTKGLLFEFSTFIGSKSIISFNNRCSETSESFVDHLSNNNEEFEFFVSGVGGNFKFSFESFTHGN